MQTQADPIRRFPWPFTADRYAYSANVEPAPALRPTAAGAWGERIFDIDGDYAAELGERRAVLARDPSRHIVLPHMQAAAWDALLWGLQDLAGSDPALVLRRDGADFVWTNGRLGTEQRFRHGDDAALPAPPLAFLCSQVQEDAVLLDQRSGTAMDRRRVRDVCIELVAGLRCRHVVHGNTRPGAA